MVDVAGESQDHILPPPAASVVDMGGGVIALYGELDLSSSSQVAPEIEALVGAHAEDPRGAIAGDGAKAVVARIVFDLGGLDFMDSAGIALLLRAASRAGPVGVRNPSDLIRRVIELTGLGDLLVIEDG